MRFKSKNNESGVILVVVISFILIMSIALVGLISRNTSSSLSSVEQSKRTKASILARGAYWQAFNLLSAGCSTLSNQEITLDNINYYINYTKGGVPLQVNVVVTYQ